MRRSHTIRLETKDFVIIEVTDTMKPERDYWLKLPASGYRNWMKGMHAQDAFPALNKSQREILISGVGPQTWNEVFGKEE